MGASTDRSQQFIDPSEQATYPSDQSTGPSVCSLLTVHWNIHIVQLSGVSRLLFKLLKYHYCWDLHGVYIGQDALHLYMKIHVTVLGLYTSILSFLSYLYLYSLSFLSFLSFWCLSFLSYLSFLSLLSLLSWIFVFFVPFVFHQRLVTAKKLKRQRQKGQTGQKRHDFFQILFSILFKSFQIFDENMYVSLLLLMFFNKVGTMVCGTWIWFY